MSKTEDYKNVVKIAWSKNSCEKMISFLESLNFRFVSKHYLEERANLPNLPPNPYHYLVKMVHWDKDPKKDLMSFRLVVGIDLEGRNRKVYFWLNGKPYKKGKKIWGKGAQVNFKPKKKGTKYPDWMSIQDRIDYRRIEKKLANRGCTKEEADFYNKCYPAVERINGRL